MKKWSLLILSFLFSNYVFAISLCSPGESGDAYQNPSSCVPAKPLSAPSPFGALLQPALEQDDASDIEMANFRMISLSPGQSYHYQLFDGLPNKQLALKFTPIIDNNGNLALDVGLSLPPSLKLASHNPKKRFNLNDSQCWWDSEASSLRCGSFNQFLIAIKPILQEIDEDMGAQIDSLLSLQPSAIELQKNGGQASLNIRYISVCSGSLVAPDLFITAAHCVLDIDENSPTLDSTNRQDVVAIGSDWTQTENIAFIDSTRFDTSYVHPEYFNDLNAAYDVALIPLQTNISNISPAKLSKQNLSEKALSYVAGFGMTEPYQRREIPTDNKAKARYLSQLSSKTLLYGSNTLVSHEQCSEDYINANLPTAESGFEQLICAGKATQNTPNNSEVAFCAGDSGGPLFTIDDGYTLYGSVSGKGAQCQNGIESGASFYPVPGLYSSMALICASGWLDNFNLSCR